jgi:hypothetical protein
MAGTDLLARLARELGDACGFELALVKGSESFDGEYLAGTARSPPRSAAPRPVTTEALAKILISPDEAGGTEAWALVFFFVNGQRVAPSGRSHLALTLEQGDDGAARWTAVRWEVDEFGEWNGLERLDPE